MTSEARANKVAESYIADSEAYADSEVNVYEIAKAHPSDDNMKALLEDFAAYVLAEM